MLAAAAVLLVLLVALAVREVAVLVAVTLHKMQLLEQQILAVAVEATTESQELLRLSVLVL